MDRIVRHPDLPMAEIMVPITVAGILDPSQEVRCAALVDTGAHCLTLPLTWRDRFGPIPMARTVEVELADGRVVAGELCGPLGIRIADFNPVAGEVLFIDMSADEQGRLVPLIGHITLEQSRVVIDMATRQLRFTPRVAVKRALRAA